MPLHDRLVDAQNLREAVAHSPVTLLTELRQTGKSTLACQPVIVVADRLPAVLAPGDEHSISVHVISDARDPIVGLHAEATLEWPEGSQSWGWEGAVGSDECALVGTFHWRVPDASGPTALHLRLTGPVEATNRYDAVIFG